MNVDLRHGDCVELMRQMPDNSVDSVVTDPPYGLEFMGKDWDAPWKAGEVVTVTDEATNGTFHTKGFKHGVRYSRGRQEMLAFQEWFETVAVECLRVLKPGGHLLAFGGTRTYHRMACAIEDAGFEIRDSIHWVYGSGFPKSLNIGKAIDKAAGAEREVVGHKPKGGGGRAAPSHEGWQRPWMSEEGAADKPFQVTAPATEDAARWEGWGTALKPAHEPIVVARKPLAGTVAGNVLVWGTGGLNIDGCRVGTEPAFVERPGHKSVGGLLNQSDEVRVTSGGAGRWPANVVFDRTAGEALDQQSGETGTSKRSVGKVTGTTFGSNTPMPDDLTGVLSYGDKGGASRYFTQADFGPDDWPFVYQAKPSRKERNAGLDGLPEKDVHRYGAGIGEGKDPNAPARDGNHHPTVKPVALMRHLVRLVTPPGGTVLDPFAGSGTTLVAAVLEGFDAIGCEMTDEYLPIIEGRVAWAEEQAFIREELDKLTPKQERLL
jgi:site-specific DNA-methyltransferase (adenine-specific)